MFGHVHAKLLSRVKGVNLSFSIPFPIRNLETQLVAVTCVYKQNS